MGLSPGLESPGPLGRTGQSTVSSSESWERKGDLTRCGPPQACGLPPQASVARHKLADRHHKLLWTATSLRSVTASFCGPPQACGTPPQASVACHKLAERHRKLLWPAASLRSAAASFCGPPQACGTPPQASVSCHKLAERRHKLL